MAKDRKIAELEVALSRGHGRSSPDDHHLVPSSQDREMLAVASNTINSLQAQIIKKDQELTKYQNLLREARKEALEQRQVGCRTRVSRQPEKCLPFSRPPTESFA